MLIALDTETTGIDPQHGSKPFSCSLYHGADTVYTWTWHVDPYTRQPQVIENNLDEIRDWLQRCDRVIFHNPKFDIRMLATVGIDDFPWEKVEDTLTQSHIINSLPPHSLEHLAMKHLRTHIQPLEDRVQKCCVAARREAERLGWSIAQKGRPDMPSAKEKVWKYDMWIPRQLAEEQGLAEDHEWHHATHNYEAMDPTVTYYIFKKQEAIIKEQGLEKLYHEQLRQIPVIYRMEKAGVTYSTKRMAEQIADYTKESAKAAGLCVGIAKGMGYDLSLPKSGNNKSLGTFVFGGDDADGNPLTNTMQLTAIKVSKKTKAPSLDSEVLSSYLATLPPRSKQRKFVEALAAKRKRDTALGYMEGYQRFSLPIAEGWERLYPSINLTGTKTLRASSSNPNEQNISKKEGFNLRYSFGPAPGREWWALDYDNLELRIPAYECEEPAMLELFEKPNDPPFFGSYHLLIFSILYPDEFSKYGVEVKARFKSTLYQWTKNGNFAELYGAVDTGDGKSTADRAFHYPGAQQIVSSKLQKKAALNRHWIDFAKEHGYVTTMPDKSIDPDHGYPLQCPRTQWGDISPTIPLNYHVQGTACWVKRRALVKCAAYLQRLNAKIKGDLQQHGYHIVMEVHDEIVFDLPAKPNKGNLPTVRKLRTLMESCGKDIGVPLTCGVDYHPVTWSQAVAR